MILNRSSVLFCLIISVKSSSIKSFGINELSIEKTENTNSNRLDSTNKGAQVKEVPVYGRSGS